MHVLRGWTIVAWIALPTVMFGGYSLLRLLTRDKPLTPFKETWFRAGHAHAGVLLLMSLVYYLFLESTSLSIAVKEVACAVLVLGILAQSGGFFIHMAVGQPGRHSVGNAVTIVGAALLVIAIAILVFGLLTAS